jgi:F0F1-type ATP synthase assembly protein I
MQQPPDSPSHRPDDGLGIGHLIGLGAILVGSVVFGTLIGWVLDQAVGSDPVLTLAGLGLGIAVGVVGCWVQVRRFLA